LLLDTFQTGSETTLLVEHDMDVVFALADRVTLKKGQAINLPH